MQSGAVSSLNLTPSMTSKQMSLSSFLTSVLLVFAFCFLLKSLGFKYIFLLIHYTVKILTEAKNSCRGLANTICEDLLALDEAQLHS